MIDFASIHPSLKGVAYSLQGGRPDNQDDFGFSETPLGFAVVVCDGMGGGPGGRTASSVAMKTILDTLCNASPNESVRTALSKAVNNAQSRLSKMMVENPELRGMGSTLSMILFSEEAAYVAHLGDSRAYRISGDKMTFRTNDHSLVGELVLHKTLTEEEARNSPQSNIITRGLGSISNNTIEIDEVPYKRGDRFFICTDGVWGTMSQQNLLGWFTEKSNINKIAQELALEVDRIGMRNPKSHYDNHTLAIIEVNANSRLKDKLDMNSRIIIASLGGLLVLSIILNIVLLVSLYRNGDKTISQGTEVIGGQKTDSYAGIPKNDYSQDNQNRDGLEINGETVSFGEAIDAMNQGKKIPTESDESGKSESVEEKSETTATTSDGQNEDIKSMLRLLDEMRTCKQTPQSKASQHQERKRDSLQKCLKKLNDDPNYKGKVNKIIVYLTENGKFNKPRQVVITNIEEKKEKNKPYYIPTGAAIKVIDTLEVKIKEL